MCVGVLITELRQPVLLAKRQGRMMVECDGAVIVTAAPPYFCVLVVVVTGGVNLNPGSQVIEKMVQTGINGRAERRFQRDSGAV